MVQNPTSGDFVSLGPYYFWAFLSDFFLGFWKANPSCCGIKSNSLRKFHGKNLLENHGCLPFLDVV